MAKKFSFDDGFLYVCDPSARIALTKEPNIKQAQLFCFKCSITVNITAANIISLPTNEPTVLTNRPTETIDKIIFKHSPIYGGLCLRPECDNKQGDNKQMRQQAKTTLKLQTKSSKFSQLFSACN
jgi:hypothetical protein